MRPGHRIDGDRSRTVRGAGWEYYHAAVDDASRVAYGEVRPSERKEDAVAFLMRVVAFFGSQGVKISQLMTDSGSAYRSKRFRRVLRELGITHIFTRPYTPRTNGKGSASAAPRSRSGPTAGPIPTPACGRGCSVSGSTTTT